MNDVYESNDDGKTWEKVSMGKKKSNKKFDIVKLIPYICIVIVFLIVGSSNVK